MDKDLLRKAFYSGVSAGNYYSLPDEKDESEETYFNRKFNEFLSEQTDTNSQPSPTLEPRKYTVEELENAKEKLQGLRGDLCGFDSAVVFEIAIHVIQKEIVYLKDK